MRSAFLAGCGKNSVYTQYTVGTLHNGADVKIASGCSKRPSSKAAASEEARRTLRYVERLSDVRTPLVDFFSILLVHLKESASFDLHEEERTIQCSIWSKRRRSREGGEVRLCQQLVVDGFARGGAFSNRI